MLSQASEDQRNVSAKNFMLPTQMAADEEGTLLTEISSTSPKHTDRNTQSQQGLLYNVEDTPAWPVLTISSFQVGNACVSHY